MKKKISERFTEIIEILSESGYHEPKIWPFSDFDAVFHGKTTKEILDAVFYGDYHPDHHYFYFDKVGNLVTLSNEEIEPYLEELFAEWEFAEWEFAEWEEKKNEAVRRKN